MHRVQLHQDHLVHQLRHVQAHLLILVIFIIVQIRVRTRHVVVVAAVAVVVISTLSQRIFKTQSL